MIAADSSSIIAFLAGEEAADTEAVKNAIIAQRLFLPPVVLTELLSDPSIRFNTEIFIIELPILLIRDGFWLRAARTRAKILKLGLKAKIADALIAQSCIDHKTPLITRDKDFKQYVKHCGLRLYA